MTTKKRHSLRSIKGKDNSMHPNSRKAQQIGRALMRHDKLAHNKRSHELKMHPMGERLLYFKAQLEILNGISPLDSDEPVDNDDDDNDDENTENDMQNESATAVTAATEAKEQQLNEKASKLRPLTHDEMHELIEMHIARNEAELEGLRSMHRKGQPRPKAAREDAIIFLQKREMDEYTQAGFEVPDITTNSGARQLAKWDGAIHEIKLIRTVRMRKSQKTQQSQQQASSEMDVDAVKLAGEAPVAGDANVFSMLTSA